MKTKIFLFTMLCISLVFSGCFSPWAGDEQGNLIISVGGGQARDAAGGVPANINNYLHIVTITGFGGQQHETRFVGSGKASFFVSAGRWHVEVKAYDDISNFIDNIYGLEITDTWPPLVYEGSADVDVRAGDNPVTIKMAKPVGKRPSPPPGYFQIILVLNGGSYINGITPSNDFYGNYSDDLTEYYMYVRDGLTYLLNSSDKDDFVFDGWYTNNLYSSDAFWNLDNAVARNITLYAKWTTDVKTYNLNVGIITGQNGFEIWNIVQSYKNEYSYGTVSIQIGTGTQISDTYSTGTSISHGGDEQDDLTASSTFLNSDKVTITATAKSGYKFVKWVKTYYINGDTFKEGDEYKELKDYHYYNLAGVTEGTTITLYAVFDSDNDGSTTPKNITSVDDLEKIGVDDKYPIGGKYALMTDLQIKEFSPISGNSGGKFSGDFDGRGHNIGFVTNSVKTIKIENEKLTGLFAWIDDSGIVRNLQLYGHISIIDSNITNSFSIGAVAGLNTGTIKNVKSSVIVEGSASGIDKIANASFAGGIAGDNGGTIINCVTTGIVGAGNSYAYNVGGIVGGNAGIIENCLATGDVYATMNAGGIVGDAEPSANCRIINCVALNGEISAHRNDPSDPNDDYVSFGRIVGLVGVYVPNVVSLSNNYARDGMIANGSSSYPFVNDATKKDGKNVLESDYTDNNWWKKTSSADPSGPGFLFGTSENEPWDWRTTSISLPRLWFY